MDKTRRVLLWAALLFCLLVLSKFILFKKSPSFYRHYFGHEYTRYHVKDGWKQSNLQLFHTIQLFSSNNVRTEYRYKNIGGNIVGFIPLGILLPLLFSGLAKFWRLTLTIFLLSLSFETFQLLAGTGIFDVDDLLLNTFGGIIGLGLFAAARWAFQKL